MIFYVRAWVVNGVIASVNSNAMPIGYDAITINGADRYDLVLGGEYMYADDVRNALTFDNGVFGGLKIVSLSKL